MTELMTLAEAARLQAYVPYSGFHVGCAIKTDDGRIFTGCNVENAAYPQGHCAERSAVGAMITAGARGIAEMAVSGSGPEPCRPCGGCRQLLNEFASADVMIHCGGTSAASMSVRLGDLLPHSFGPSDLGMVSAKSADALQTIRAKTQFVPKIAIVLGSGLGALVEAVDRAAEFSFAELAGFPQAGVQGHAGRLVLGELGGVPVACLAGRVHAYEGDVQAQLKTMIRTLKALGSEALLLTNAAGSLREAHGPGSLVRITDHINLQGTNPLVGPNDDAHGPRFVDLSKAYDPELGQVLDRAAERSAIALGQGVYAAWLGPAFETPAEIRALRILGADLVGMSTVPEVIIARHCGLRCAAISMVTNLAAGMAEQTLSHEHTLAQASKAAPALVTTIQTALPEMLEVLNAV